jgi:hypothetical protein
LIDPAPPPETLAVRVTLFRGNVPEDGLATRVTASGVVEDEDEATGISAQQEAFVPPNAPLHGHSHSLPAEVTVPAVPALQRLNAGSVAGEEAKISPRAVPQLPLIGRLTEQLALDPPFAPMHGQLQPLLVVITPPCVPDTQRPDVGNVELVVPFIGPQTPFTIESALQLSLNPPLTPVHDQRQPSVAKLTVLEFPAEQRPVVGVVAKVPPSDGPQVPSTMTLAEQDVDAPPFIPVQVHVHLVALFNIETAVPAPQR